MIMIVLRTVFTIGFRGKSSALELSPSLCKQLEHQRTCQKFQLQLLGGKIWTCIQQHHPDQHSEDQPLHDEDLPLQENMDFNDNVFDGISQLDHGDNISTSSTHPMRLRSAGTAARTSSTPTNPAKTVHFETWL